MKAYKHLVIYSLAKGHTISVWDGEEWQVHMSTTMDAIIDAIESVEEALVKILDTDGKYIGQALVIPFGLEDDETVADYGVNEYMETWSDEYDKTVVNT